MTRFFHDLSIARNIEFVFIVPSNVRFDVVNAFNVSSVITIGASVLKTF